MMMIKTMYNFLIRRQPLREKWILGIKFLKFYFDLSHELKKVYHNLDEQNSDVSNFLKMLSKEDFELLDTLFVSDVKNFLMRRKTQTKILPSEKLGMDQVGFNTINVENPESFWTTGKATFFLPTKKNATNNITIQIASIPQTNVIFGFDNNIIKKIKMSRLSEKKVKISIEPTKIKNDISKIFITTDKLWKPDVLQNQNAKVVFGIRIDSIMITYS